MLIAQYFALDESLFMLQSMHSTYVDDVCFKKNGGIGAISLLGKIILKSHSFFDKSVDSLGRIYLPIPGFNFTFVFKINAFVD